ncbi:MAG: FecR family protein [Daejeonella sp.]|uniref:FecR family protein n=1 Tax=Daejeonella sp. JGW-45 TaxID=3034148 RepID=UPI0023EB49DF|nr:FecR family protein [Daejeonella sp. JGW-45]
MQKEEIHQLIEKYLHNTASQEEIDSLFAWYRSELSAEVEWDLDEAEDEAHVKTMIFSKIVNDERISRRRYINPIYYAISIAASILLFLVAGLYYYSGNVTEQMAVADKVVAKAKPKDILPGGHKAILTLADGRKIVLDDSQNGIVINQNGINVHKNSNGIIEYTLTNQRKGAPDELADNAKVIYNTIETPVGGKFQLNLADGSKVWLNSASSLRFPVIFTDDTRQVELKGEAYFEVSRDIHRKFSVRSGNQSVEVLGTHFNINAYSDEPTITTTLIEGKVRVIELNTKESQILQPGEQSKVDRNIRIQRTTDTQTEVAWKDGYFYFENAPIETVMRQLGRWYGVTAKYEGVLPQHHFAGAISTNLTLLEVLEILEKSNVHFRLEGKEVVVMP